LCRSAAFIDAHRVSPSDFIRRRVLPFELLVAFLLHLVGGMSLTPALDQFFQFMDPERAFSRRLTKSAFSQARKKLKASALAALNALWVSRVQAQGDFARWCGLQVIAADGTCVRVSSRAENAQAFGAGPCGDASVLMARVLGLFCVASRQMVQVVIGRYDQGERDLLLDGLDALAPDSVLVMDRGFPATGLFALLTRRQQAFCARLDGCSWPMARDFLRSGLAEQLVQAPLTRDARRYLRARAEPIPKTVSLRLVKVVLPSGHLEVLVTSLTDTVAYPAAEFCALYRSRWGIEEAFKTLKHRLHLEGFSGDLPHAVEQEIHAKVLMANIAQALSHEAFRQLPAAKQAHCRVNHAVAIKHLPRLIQIALNSCRSTLCRAVAELVELLTKTTEWFRPDRSYPRNHAKTGAQRPRQAYR
jgi:hypothetical protein